jgi:hypothetical protein
MRLKAKTAQKFADRFRPTTSLGTKNEEGGYHQTEEPTAAFFRCPQPRLWVAVAACHRLGVTLHTSLRKPVSCGKASNALLAVCTNRVENPPAFRPKSHVGRSSDGRLNSGVNLVS